MQLHNNALFMGSYLPPLQVWPQVIHPPQSAALSIPFQPCTASKRQGHKISVLTRRNTRVYGSISNNKVVGKLHKRILILTRIIN
jgi:hypothetical protein